VRLSRSAVATRRFHGRPCPSPSMRRPNQPTGGTLQTQLNGSGWPVLKVAGPAPPHVQIQSAGGIKKMLFNWAFARKLHFMKGGAPQAKVG